MFIKVVIGILLFIPSVLYAENVANHIDPSLEQFIHALLKQEGIDQAIEIYDAGSNFHSLAAISIGFSTNDASRLSMIINQEKFNLLTLEEQQFVILHEIGHIKRNPYKGLICAFAPMIISAIATTVTLAICFPRSWNDALRTGAIACGAAYLSNLMSKIYFARLSRQEEFAADAYAYAIQHNTQAMCSVLEKRKKMFEKHYPTSWWGKLFEDHPSSQERIAHIKAIF